MQSAHDSPTCGLRSDYYKYLLRLWVDNAYCAVQQGLALTTDNKPVEYTQTTGAFFPGLVMIQNATSI